MTNTTTKTVCVKNADWVVAWDATNGRHAYLERADVAWDGETLLHVEAPVLTLLSKALAFGV